MFRYILKRLLYAIPVFLGITFVIYTLINLAPVSYTHLIDQAFVKVGIGAEKKSKVISEKEKKITAYHEAGHGILFHVLPDVGPVHTISIIPTGMGAAGYTMPLPEKDEMFNTKGKMLQNIMVSLGGRIAEELIFGDVTTGASQDIKQATAIARAMVTEYGMSEKVGMINYGGDENEVFIGRDLAHARSYGESVATAIDSEVKRIIDECYEKAKKIILDHENVLHKCCELLLEKEKISQDAVSYTHLDRHGQRRHPGRHAGGGKGSGVYGFPGRSAGGRASGNGGDDHGLCPVL